MQIPQCCFIALLSMVAICHSGCAVLGQTWGANADIEGKIVMPDGKPATDVDIIVSYERIVRLPEGDLNDVDFYDKIRSKDGTFRVKYSKVITITLTAQKPSWRSFTYKFTDKDLVTKGVTIILNPVGTYPDQEKLERYSYGFLLRENVKGGGIRLGDRNQGFDRVKLKPVEESDFFVERILVKHEEGDAEELHFRVRKGFELFPLKTPLQDLPKYAERDSVNLAVAPEGGYDQLAIPLNAKPSKTIYAFFRTPEGKYGYLYIWDYGETRGDGGVPEWKVRVGYTLNPDGSRNLDTYKIPSELEEKEAEANRQEKK